jgi:acetylornithine deacetylase/succinyl-diaminopimelate desuccinylase-like protein
MTADLRPFLDLDACVEDLRGLIRIPSVNPPDGGSDVAAGRDPRGGEAAAARYCAEVLVRRRDRVRGRRADPGRGSCVARLAATGPGHRAPVLL